MCANNQTLAAVTGQSDDDKRANNHYQTLISAATRATIYDTDQEAADAAEAARRFAHRESHRGNIDPLLDQLCRAYDLPSPALACG